MFDTSGSVAHVRPVEVALYFLRPMLSAPEKSSDVACQLPLCPRALPPNGVGFDILIEQFVRVELRAVSRKKVNSDSPGMPYPTYNILRKMDRVPVDNQKDFARMLPGKALQEVEKQWRCKPPFENPEGQCAPVGNRRNHIATEPFARAWDDRRMSAPAVRGACLVIRTHPGLVAPEDSCFLPTSQSADGGILSFQPAAHRSRILFVGMPYRLLRGKAPAGQIATHSPDREPSAKTLLNQILDCFACPEHKRQLELVGAAVGNQPSYRRRLVRFEVQDTWPAAWLGAQSRKPFGALALIPGVDRLPGNAKHTGRFGLRHSRPDGADDSYAQAVLGARRHITHIQNWHTQNYTKYQCICQTFLLRLVKAMAGAKVESPTFFSFLARRFI